MAVAFFAAAFFFAGAFLAAAFLTGAFFLTGPRGPAPGTGRFLTPVQEAAIRELICRGTPDAYGLRFALWGRAGAMVEFG